VTAIGAQHERAAHGTDPRGWLVFTELPADLQNAEDSTAAADAERKRAGPHGFPHVELAPVLGAVWVVVGRVRQLDTAELRDDSELLRLGWVGWDGFIRDATAAERALLEHLGHDVPELLYTTVTWPTGGIRNRRWTQLEGTTP
jgi:hypothetical protein